MKTSTKVAIVSLATSVLLGAYIYFDSKKPVNPAPKDNGNIDSIVDGFYNLFPTNETSPSLNELLTEQKLRETGNFNSEDEVVSFFEQLKIQAEEYDNSTNFPKVREGLKVLNRITQDFILNKPYRGYTYYNLTIHNRSIVIGYALKIQECNNRELGNVVSEIIKELK